MKNAVKTQKTEHPILFSTSMVQAILKGQKTKTRRILKVKGCKSFIPAPSQDWDVETLIKWGALDKCNYGKIGDKLWVRETFEEGCMGDYIYKADRSELEIKQYKECGYTWKPSIYMPKKAARIWLQIESLKIERLQDISEDDAKSEGIKRAFYDDEYHYLVYPPKEKNKGLFAGPCRIDGSYVSVNSAFGGYTPATYSFHSLWDSINGGGNWDKNPWVWVIEFKRINL